MRAFSNEVDTGSRKENASKKDQSPVLIQSEPTRLLRNKNPPARAGGASMALMALS
jgi:hypothetical protein